MIDVNEIFLRMPIEKRQDFLLDWIASVTKLFIAAAILKLHEQGRVFID